MGKDKIRRFAAIKTYTNVFEPVIGETFYMKGRWNEDYFRNDNPLVLELGCGKGEYSVGMARKFKDKNFIGIDIKGARMFIGATEAIDEELKNVAFLRTKIDFINDCFEANEVDEIWLTFSDPQPKKPNKRLCSQVFIDRYKKMIKPGGQIHLKTDSDLLYDFTLEEIISHGYDMIFNTCDLYSENVSNISEQLSDILPIKTHYEKLFTAKGAIIKYCCFKVN
jgi:tRNA (guanine-N7-)-methyltransferase